MKLELEGNILPSFSGYKRLMCVHIVANFCNQCFYKHGSWCGSSLGRLAGILMIMVARNALFYSALYDVHSPPPFACSFLFFGLVIDYIWRGFTVPQK
jgi:hypothetical protein